MLNSTNGELKIDPFTESSPYTLSSAADVDLASPAI